MPSGAWNAPLTPVALNVEMAPLSPAALSNDWKGDELSAAPNVTAVTRASAES